MNPTVSIIVPVYNAESSLSRCVDSILGQEYQDFELLLADDGSTDRSGSICDAYAASDSRCKGDSQIKYRSLRHKKHRDQPCLRNIPAVSGQ